MYETFKKVSFFNFCRKNHHQNPHRYVFEFFLYTKSISRYYRNYRLFIRYSCYQSKNFTFFFVFSTHFPHSWRVEISLFSIIFTIVQTPTPPLSVLLRKRQKVPKFYLSVFWKKIENPQCCWENVFFEIFENTRTYGDFDENVQKIASRLRVKTGPFQTQNFQQVHKCGKFSTYFHA